MSIAEIEAREAKELADIDGQIAAAKARHDQDGVERLHDFRTKREVDYWVEKSRDPEFTNAKDHMRGLGASFALMDSPGLGRISDIINAFSAATTRMAKAVTKHAERKRKPPAKDNADDADSTTKPETAKARAATVKAAEPAAPPSQSTKEATAGKPLAGRGQRKPTRPGGKNKKSDKEGR